MRIESFFKGIELPAKYQQEADEAIAWAKTVLKRPDRIRWYLRWFRLALLQKIVDHDGGEDAERLANTFNDYFEEMLDNTHKSADMIHAAANMMYDAQPAMKRWTDLFDLIPKVDAVYWDWQMPKQMMIDLANATRGLSKEERQKIMAAFPDSILMEEEIDRLKVLAGLKV